VTTHPFYIVDVFAVEKYAGNQLAVVMDAADISDETMQRIAQEMNYAETTFVLSNQIRDGGYDVRIFTPAVEVPFAGHPTLGTAYIIREKIIGQAVETVILNFKVGQIRVTFADDGVIWMRQNPPTFGKKYDRTATAEVLGIGVDDIDDRFPVQEVSTGLPFIIVPIKTLDAMKQARIDVRKLRTFIEGGEAMTIAAFCPQTYHDENDINVRVFADLFNIPEDPATGSANGCLSGYLVKYRYFDRDSIAIRAEQGYEIKRRSLLLHRSANRGDDIEINIGGRVIPIASGELF